MPAEKEIAVILIHGIGDLEPHDILNSAASGIRRALPHVQLPNAENRPVRQKVSEKGKAYVNTLDAAWGKGRVHLTEFFWAYIPGKIRALHPIAALVKILGVLKEFPTISVSESTSPHIFRLAVFFGHLQQALVLLTLVLFIILVADGIRKAPDLHFLDTIETISIVADRDIEAPVTPEDTVNLNKALCVLWSDYPLLVILMAIALLSAMASMFLLAGCFIFPAAAVARLRRWHQPGILWRTATASTFLMTLAIWVIVFLGEGILMAVNMVTTAGIDRPPLPEDTSLAAVMLALMFLAIGKLMLVVANLLRDVIHYLATDADGQPLKVQEQIQNELWDLILQTKKRGDPSKIVLIAHSLGTVIVVDMLRRRANALPPEQAFRLDIVTAGSPLKRLIHRLLPNRLPLPATVFNELKQASAFTVDRWLNTYRILDYVGQRLTTRKDPPGQITDLPLVPRYRPPFGHANYWKDSRFLDLVATRVITPIMRDDARTATHTRQDSS